MANPSYIFSLTSKQPPCQKGNHLCLWGFRKRIFNRHQLCNISDRLQFLRLYQSICHHLCWRTVLETELVFSSSLLTNVELNVNMLVLLTFLRSPQNARLIVVVVGVCLLPFPNLPPNLMMVSHLLDKLWNINEFWFGAWQNNKLLLEIRQHTKPLR